MKTLIAILSILIALLPTNSLARGGFSSGRSSFSSGRSSFGGGRSSFSGGRSSFGSGRSSFGSKSGSSSGSSSRSRGSSGWGSGRSKNSGSSFGSSSRGRFGMGDTKASQYTPRTSREILRDSPRTIRTPYHPVEIYYYYYPTPFYGSGYSFYQWYYWSHFWGNHSHCYHQGGGLAPPPRKCDEKVKDKGCYEGEYCELKTHECRVKDW